MNRTAAQTVAILRQRRELGLVTRRHRVPRAVPPSSVERAYAGAIRGFVVRWRAAAFADLGEVPALLASAARERARTDADEGRRLREIVSRTSQRMEAAVPQPEIEALAEQFARNTETWQRRQMDRQVRAALGVDLSTTSAVRDRWLGQATDGFVAENVELIKDIEGHAVAFMSRTITRAVASGTLWPDLAEEIETEFGYGRARARLIARDQVGKYYGQVTAQRHQDLGITGYTWRCVDDERVRGRPDGKYPRAEPSHWDRNGKEYRYDEPPEGGHPGEAILCRCTQEPVFDGILSGL